MTPNPPGRLPEGRLREFLRAVEQCLECGPRPCEPTWIQGPYWYLRRIARVILEEEKMTQRFLRADDCGAIVKNTLGIIRNAFETLPNRRFGDGERFVDAVLRLCIRKYLLTTSSGEPVSASELADVLAVFDWL